MPDEVGTETTRADAPSTDESLFGDAADNAAAAVADDQDAGGESEQDPQGTDDAEEQAAGDETGSSEDLKVVVSIKGNRATIGVQQPAADPHIESFDDGDLSGLAQEVPAVIERARAKWEEAPKYPAHARTRSPGQAADAAGAGACAGRGRRGRGGPAATRDAAAVLGAGHCNPQPSMFEWALNTEQDREPVEGGLLTAPYRGRTPCHGALPLYNHICGPFCISRAVVAAPHRRAAPHSVSMWPRPRSLARFRSAAKWRTLGRTTSSLQRLIVGGPVPSRQSPTCWGTWWLTTPNAP